MIYEYFYTVFAISVCINAQILATIHARDVKFGMKLSVYHMQIKYIFN